MPKVCVCVCVSGSGLSLLEGMCYLAEIRETVV